MLFNKNRICSSIETVKQNVHSTFDNERIHMVALSKLHFDKDFKNLFQQEPVKVDKIAADMEVNGFDKSQPIILTTDYSILDGNSRYLASKKAGIKYVPAVFKRFQNKDEALRYELHLQLDRRNLSDAEIFTLFQKLEKMKLRLKKEGEPFTEFTDEKIANQLNKSARQVQKIRELTKKASEQTLDKITSGQITINQAYNEVKKTNKTTCIKSNDKRNIKIDEFRKGVQFALDELAKGKNSEEILHLCENLIL